MKSLVEYLKIDEANSAELIKQAKELLDEYSNFDDEDTDATKDLLERAINLVSSAKGLNKKDVNFVLDEYNDIEDLDDPDELEGPLEDVMNLVMKIK